MLTKSVYCVKSQDCELPMYDGLTIVNEFVEKFESAIPEYQRFDALKWALYVTST